VDEVVRDVRATGSPYIFFTDDNIAANRAYTMRLLEAIKPLGIVWGSQCNVSACEDEEFLAAAHDSGCFSLFLGMESLEQGNLDAHGKTFNRVAEYGGVLGKLSRAGVAASVGMIMGMDGDGEEVFDRTREFLTKAKVPMAYFFILAPAPATTLFERLEREGRLLHKDWSRYGGDESVFVPKGMTPERLEEGFWDLYKRFYSMRSIVRRLLWPPRWDFRTVIALKCNLLHRRSLRKGIHPLRG
jgi:radical SAM superfamily enzyme YgiQ (UPF0313 family)